MWDIIILCGYKNILMIRTVRWLMNDASSFLSDSPLPLCDWPPSHLRYSPGLLWAGWERDRNPPCWKHPPSPYTHTTSAGPAGEHEVHCISLLPPIQTSKLQDTSNKSFIYKQSTWKSITVKATALWWPHWVCIFSCGYQMIVLKCYAIRLLDIIKGYWSQRTNSTGVIILSTAGNIRYYRTKTVKMLHKTIISKMLFL